MVEGHVKILTMHILMDMEDMVFYSLDDLNHVLIEKVAAATETLSPSRRMPTRSSLTSVVRLSKNLGSMGYRPGPLARTAL